MYYDGISHYRKNTLMWFVSRGIETFYLSVWENVRRSEVM